MDKEKYVMVPIDEYEALAAIKKLVEEGKKEDMVLIIDGEHWDNCNNYTTWTRHRFYSKDETLKWYGERLSEEGQRAEGLEMELLTLKMELAMWETGEKRKKWKLF